MCHIWLFSCLHSCEPCLANTGGKHIAIDQSFLRLRNGLPPHSCWTPSIGETDLFNILLCATTGVAPKLQVEPSQQKIIMTNRITIGK